MALPTTWHGSYVIRATRVCRYNQPVIFLIKYDFFFCAWCLFIRETSILTERERETHLHDTAFTCSFGSWYKRTLTNDLAIVANPFVPTESVSAYALISYSHHLFISHLESFQVNRTIFLANFFPVYLCLILVPFFIFAQTNRIFN